MITAELSDEDIQRQLAGESLRGPRIWRGRELAPLTRGLRDLRNKVVAPDDTGAFHDTALLHILAEAHHAAVSTRLEKRRALLVATDDVPTFRAAVSLLMDDLSDEDLAEVRRLTNEILGIVEAAEVSLAEKKTVSPDPAALSPMTTRSSSPPPSASPEAGLPTSSAGS
ncbi:MAG: hypothetical protein QOE70_4384 [Chthoniobacter sp.]|jgi:hypothetical protein|nr:hypothetical protein [Chthoniobacter sp.]